MISFSIRDEIIEVVNKLFIYTDMQEWEKLQDEVFSESVLFDMSSLGGRNEEISAKQICSIWRNGFVGIDSVNHLAGNYLVQINDKAATVFAYATATHYKASATKGKTREFTGTYNIGLVKLETGWRVYQFKYDLKYSIGNVDLS